MLFAAPVWALKKFVVVKKEKSGSESGEECLGDQPSWSKDGWSCVNKSNQQYHDEYSHSLEEYEANVLFDD